MGCAIRGSVRSREADLSETDDGALVTAVLADRSEPAFTRLYDRHTPALYGLALRLVGGDEPQAEDVVQEAWIRAVERLARFRRESPLRTWLCGFVIRIVHERQSDRTWQSEVLDPDIHAAEDVNLTGVLDRVDLERALATLPPGFRHVLVLHDVEGLTHDEIGALLSVVPGTSKSQLARARAALRRSLAEPREG